MGYRIQYIAYIRNIAAFSNANLVCTQCAVAHTPNWELESNCYSKEYISEENLEFQATLASHM